MAQGKSAVVRSNAQNMYSAGVDETENGLCFRGIMTWSDVSDLVWVKLSVL